MLSFWSPKPEGRPDFATIVNTLTSYLVATSDYLDLAAVDKDKNPDLVKVCPEDYCMASSKLEDNPERSLTHVPAQANAYH